MTRRSLLVIGSLVVVPGATTAQVVGDGGGVNGGIPVVVAFANYVCGRVWQPPPPPRCGVLTNCPPMQHQQDEFDKTTGKVIHHPTPEPPTGQWVEGRDVLSVHFATVTGDDGAASSPGSSETVSQSRAIGTWSYGSQCNRSLHGHFDRGGFRTEAGHPGYFELHGTASWTESMPGEPTQIRIYGTCGTPEFTLEIRPSTPGSTADLGTIQRTITGQVTCGRVDRLTSEYSFD